MNYSKKELLAVLARLTPGLAAKELIEQSTCYAFKNNQIYTFNDRVVVRHHTDIDIEGAVPAAELYGFLNKASSDMIDITIEGDVLLIKAGRAKAKIAMNTQIRLPIASMTETSEWYELPPRFNELVAMTSLSIGTDLARPIYTCIHWTPEFIEACDQYRLTRSFIKTPGLEKKLLVPGADIGQLLKYKPMLYSLSEGWVHFKIENGCIFSCRTFAGVYPDLLPLIKKQGVKKITFPPTLAEALDRAAIMSEDKEGSAATFSSFDIKGNEMTITAMSAKGSFEESIAVDSEIDVSFKTRNNVLKAVLKYFTTAHISEDSSQLVFSNDDLVHIVALTRTTS